MNLTVAEKPSAFKMADASFQLPPTLNANDDNISEAFKKWKRQLTVYMTASGTPEKSNKVQSAVILHRAGTQMIDIYEHFEWENEDGTDISVEDRNDPVNVLKKIEEHCIPR